MIRCKNRRHLHSHHPSCRLAKKCRIKSALFTGNMKDDPIADRGSGMCSDWWMLGGRLFQFLWSTLAADAWLIRMRCFNGSLKNPHLMFKIVWPRANLSTWNTPLRSQTPHLLAMTYELLRHTIHDWTMGETGREDKTVTGVKNCDHYTH